eukprot:1463065-Alexandrium_andersonii.AAC.1
MRSPLQPASVRNGNRQRSQKHNLSVWITTAPAACGADVRWNILLATVGAASPTGSPRQGRFSPWQLLHPTPPPRHVNATQKHEHQKWWFDHPRNKGV